VAYVKPLLNALVLALLFGALIGVGCVVEGISGAKTSEQLTAVYRGALGAGAIWASFLFVPLALLVVVRVHVVRRRRAASAGSEAGKSGA
jgi:hypothetical protein